MRISVFVPATTSPTFGPGRFSCASDPGLPQTQLVMVTTIQSDMNQKTENSLIRGSK